MKFPVCVTLAKYEKDMLSLYETTNVFIDAFVLFQNPFLSVGSFILIRTMLKYLNVCKVYLQCGIVIQRVVTKHGLPSVQLSQMMNLKIKLAKNKCLGTICSTEMNPIA